MPSRLGDLSDDAGLAIGDQSYDAVFEGDFPVWAKAAGSAAVDIVLGPVREVGSPAQRRLVQVTISGTPFPRWIRLDGQENVNFGETTLQADFEQQTGTRRIVDMALTQDIDVTPTDVPLTFTVRASNGRTQDSASFTTQFEQR